MEMYLKKGIHLIFSDNPHKYLAEIMLTFLASDPYKNVVVEGYNVDIVDGNFYVNRNKQYYFRDSLYILANITKYTDYLAQISEQNVVVLVNKNLKEFSNSLISAAKSIAVNKFKMQKLEKLFPIIDGFPKVSDAKKFLTDTLKSRKKKFLLRNKLVPESSEEAYTVISF